jgi:hypothetical protein
LAVTKVLADILVKRKEASGLVSTIYKYDAEPTISLFSIIELPHLLAALYLALFDLVLAERPILFEPSHVEEIHESYIFVAKASEMSHFTLKTSGLLKILIALSPQP